MTTDVFVITPLEFRQSDLRLIFSELFRGLRSESNKSDCSRVKEFLYKIGNELVSEIFTQ